MNHGVEPKSTETEEFKTKKFDFEEFDPKPLTPEDFEKTISGFGEGKRQSFREEASKEKPSKEESFHSKGPKSEESTQGQIAGYRNVITAFSLVGQIGLVMFASVAIGLFGGMYLDRWLGTEPLLLMILTLLGVASGFRTVYMMIKKLME